MKILFILLLLSLFGCSKSDSENNANKEKINRVSVKTIELKGQPYTDYISIVGTVKPFQKALLSATESGKIIKYYKEKGDFVRKGDTILVIDNAILAANLQAAKAQYDLAKITYEKQKMVYEENVNSEIQYLQAKYNMEQLEANYKLIKTRYDNTFIIAPFAGYIDAKYFDLDEVAPIGQPIVLLIDVSKVKIEAGVPERYIGAVQKGDVAVVKVSATNEELVGKVSFVGTSVNVNNRTYPIEIILNNKNKLLKPELITEVKIEHKTFDNIIVIPNEVISRTDKSYTVYVVENNVVKSRTIEILSRTSNRIAVASGLKSGEHLVVVGYQNLIDGQAVNVVNKGNAK